MKASLFTEEEKNEIIARVEEDLKAVTTTCLWEGRCEDVCDRLFPRSPKQLLCPCLCYTQKYVKAKFWKALE